MKKSILIAAIALVGLSYSASAQSLNGLNTIKFIYDTQANWNASTRILAVNEVAIATDNLGSIKFGQALSSMQKVGPTYANLPAFVGQSAPGVVKRTAVAINATATATAAQIATGAISSTSVAATSITLPTATLLATQLKANQGETFDFIIDNGAGANTVTVALGTGYTALAVITGSNTLTVAAGSVGIFRVYFKSATTAVIARVA